MKARKFIDTRQPPFGARVAFARVTMGLGWMSLGALAVGTVAAGAMAIRALAIRSLAVKRGKVEHLAIGELEVGRLHIRELVVEETRSEPRSFKALEGHKYINLITFRRSGEPVSTTVWFALVDDSVFITTPPNSGKMKRIRNEPRVVLTPSNAWGRLRSDNVEGVARIIDGTAPERAALALRKKYRLGLAIFHLFGKRHVGRVTLEVRALGAVAEGA